jgi:hypothetical protein
VKLPDDPNTRRAAGHDIGNRRKDRTGPRGPSDVAHRKALAPKPPAKAKKPAPIKDEEIVDSRIETFLPDMKSRKFTRHTSTGR